jgi:hypothetical protein
VARPNATLELTVKTAMPKGTTIPKGRLTWPREAKPRTEERVLVFAEGRLAEEAKRAGAHIVGGLELVDDVSVLSGSRCSHPSHAVFPRLSMGVTIRLPSFACRASFARSLQSWDDCSARKASCLRRGEGLLPKTLLVTSGGCKVPSSGRVTRMARFAPRLPRQVTRAYT